MELVASFVNRSNFLKYWEKTDIYDVSTSGVHGPKNTAITRIPVHALPRSSTHCSHRTALVCSGCHTPWLMRGASARQKTRNQFCIISCDPKGFQQGFQLQKHCILTPPKDI